LIDFL